MVTIGTIGYNYESEDRDSYNDDDYPGANQGGQGEPIEKPGGNSFGH